MNAPAVKQSRYLWRLITDDLGKATYFEPGVLAAFDPKAVERD